MATAALPVDPRSLRRRSGALTILIAVKSVLATVVAFVMIEELGLLLEYRSEGLPAALAQATIERQNLLLLNLNNLVMLCAIVTWLLWQYGLRRALLAPAARPFRYGAGAGLVWWFVPFANVVVPFSVLSELWDAEAFPNRRPLEVWWLLWNGQVVLLYVMFVAMVLGILDAVGMRIVSFIAEILFLLAVVPAVRVIRQMTAPAVSALEAFASLPPAPLAAAADLAPGRDVELAI
ncbi:MAG TPA: DUF4328 domain-containing protein [Actinomycetota bacterium]|jgi:hypothetical protein